MTSNQVDVDLKVGAPVDAWWSDGWWEGVVTGNNYSGKESYQVYIPSKSHLLFCLIVGFSCIILKIV